MKTYGESEALSQSDTEITLGMQSILGIFFGLVLICGVFFGFGYSLGRGNPGKAAATAQTALPSAEATQPSDVNTVVEESSSSTDSDTYVAGPGVPTRKSAGVALSAKPSAASAAAQPQVTATTALQNTISSAKAAALAAAPVPQSAIMVQIAAVSRQQDADVLVSALNKLGYSASVRSETADNLLRVQIGPFATRDEAKAARTKLLNDGYNAILK